MTRGSAALTYSSYLALDEILGAQRPRSDEHDELLFIVIHQVYELWFKELLHEFRLLQTLLEADDTPHAVQTVHRILTILKVSVLQIDVLETMTPLQFTQFRHRLAQASGFQSAQFREIEMMLGRRNPGDARRYPPDSDDRRRLTEAALRPSVWDSFLRYLSAHGYPVPDESLHRDVREPLAASPAMQDVLVQVYRDEGGCAQAAERLVDIDETIQEWRYRHVKMVERTIGFKGGTGGSAGAGYLRETLFQPSFPDLWAVRSKL